MTNKATTNTTNTPTDRTATTPKLWVLFAAAGHGSRFGSGSAKQYQPFLHSPTLLQYTVAKVCNLLPVTQAIIILPKQSPTLENVEFNTTMPLHCGPGGDARMLSVYAGLQCAIGKGAGANDWVLIHDVARPCVSAAELLDLYQQAQLLNCSCTLATPVSDTLKKCTSTLDITANIDREQVWAIQTPQIFKVGVLQQALTHAITNNTLHNDESSAVHSLGLPVKVVAGTRANIKITYASDLALAELICQGQNPPT